MCLFVGTTSREWKRDRKRNHICIIYVTSMPNERLELQECDILACLITNYRKPLRRKFYAGWTNDWCEVMMIRSDDMWWWLENNVIAFVTDQDGVVILWLLKIKRKFFFSKNSISRKWRHRNFLSFIKLSSRLSMLSFSRTTFLLLSQWNHQLESDENKSTQKN